ncbi:hypothetical protein EV652_11675 [Kribbella steppae]|uniref:DUF7144 domain-containing protein n=1 Tax=Kribbella steppae TaxID=2512223 RepID=A0A4R2H3D0_9ACTN|nr:hypothetical protein [Kribbella steppae]TCO18054.1 hypothetical protein EV652_11675 [Kribbella steppae]
MVHEEIDERPEISGVAMAGFTFAASMMVLLGAFQITSGLAAIIDETDFEPVRRYAFAFDTTVWGWIHLAIGLAMVVAGFSLFAQRRWAGIFAIALAGFSALNNFLFISHAPAWALLVIALDVWVIWTLTRPGLLTR